MTAETEVEHFDLLPRDKSLLIFDGECVLCNSWVKFVLKNDKLNKVYVTTRSEALNSPFLRKQLHGPDSTESVVLLKDGAVFTHSDAAFMVLSELGRPFSFFSIGKYFPRFLRDGVYNIIARWRYKLFGKQTACDIEFQQKYARRFLKF